MPLGNFATILPFLSPCSPSILRVSPPAPVPSKKKNEEEQKKKKKPALRICFPLKIQRGASSWWEYEEFRIEFRDRTMWRQAFGLDGHETRDVTGCSSVSASSCYSGLEGKSGENEGDVSEGVSATAGNRFMYLIPRLLFLTKANNTSERVSSGRTSTITVGIDRKQQQQLRSAPLKLPSKGQSPHDDAPVRPPPPPPPFGTPSTSPAVPPSEAAQIQHHREITLQKLEGRYVYKPKERYLSTFRSLFRTPKSPAPESTPILPPSPLRPHSPPQNPGTCRISHQEWANLRDDIVAGLSADAEALFPFLTDDQRAAFLRVEQKEGKFKVEHGDGAGGGGAKEALERIEERGWEDVLFVEFEDTPRTMRWWYTMREPQFFEWGAGMI
ncbi:hypothetical protein M440DRAFT_1465173 [Trichoderma longibrachiatum ATCC 18648]|uniref:Uncharacterized protein n=1 Tax=Trichoderma longibrachiatum ATCC 18648 TaxID=983965 RepID=A0A2T4BUY4_TRILO|nr:hypothetical protein M440DRAFT_1465173 [Trichoderma longibrachiatum ATCC 18648]